MLRRNLTWPAQARCYRIRTLPLWDFPSRPLNRQISAQLQPTAASPDGTNIATYLLPMPMQGAGIYCCASFTNFPASGELPAHSRVMKDGDSFTRHDPRAIRSHPLLRLNRLFLPHDRAINHSTDHGRMDLNVRRLPEASHRVRCDASPWKCNR